MKADRDKFLFAARTDWQLAPNRLAQATEERHRRGLPILDLTETNPTRAGFAPGEEILADLQNVQALVYKPDPRGPLAAREAVCAYYAERGAQVTPEQVFLATSTSEAYSWLFRLLADPGDHILVPQPSYPLFDFLAGLNDLRIASYPLHYDDRWQIDVARVREMSGARTRALLVVHPNNPTGSYASPAELAGIEACCRATDTALIVDEVFLDYSLESANAASHAGACEALSFTLSGLSKIAALPQMKLGWIVASGPREILQPALERLEVIADTYLSVGAPLAYALPVWLGRAAETRASIMERLRTNLATLNGLLESSPGIRRLRVEAGWCAILQVSGCANDEEWALELLAKDGVLVHPGHFYDFAEEGCVVISLLTLPDVFREGVSRIMARLGKSR